VLFSQSSTHVSYQLFVQARLLPLSCGTTDNEMALLDLKIAHELQADDAVIKR
jgi:hypothetical protein